MNTPVRMDLLGPDDDLLSLVGRRAYVGDDPAGSLLALVAAAMAARTSG